MSYIDKIVLNGNTYNIGNNDSSSNGKYRELNSIDEILTLTCLQIHNDITDGYIGYKCLINDIINFRINVSEFSNAFDTKYGFIFYIIDYPLGIYLSYGTIGNFFAVLADNDNDTVSQYMQKILFGLTGVKESPTDNIIYWISNDDAIGFRFTASDLSCKIKSIHYDTEFGDKYAISVLTSNDSLGQLAVGDPDYSWAAANKSYVDGKISELQSQLSTLQSTIDNLNSSISALNSFKSKYESMLQVIYNG